MVKSVEERSFRWTRNIALIIAAFLMSFIAAGFVTCDAAFAESMEPGSHFDGKNGGCMSISGPRITPDMIPNTEKQDGKSLQTEPVKVIPTLVVVIGFNNIDYNNDYDWSEVMFGASNSVRAYYRDMSCDQMTFGPAEETSRYNANGNTNTKDKQNDGVVHVKVNRDHVEWDSSSNLANEARTFSDALTRASSFIDFTKYDVNNDQVLSTEEFAVVFIAAGYDGGTSHRGHDDELYLRSHHWQFSNAISSQSMTDFSVPSFTRNGKTVRIDHFSCAADQFERYNSSTNTIKAVQGRYSSVAHELGHHLGLPDLYDTSSYYSGKAWVNYEVNYASLMASGSWNINKSGNYSPASLDPWCKVFLKWATTRNITKPSTCQSSAMDYSNLSDKQSFFRINIPYTDTDADEYYLVELRNADKWDSGIGTMMYKDCGTKNKNGGLIFWHVDEKVLDACYNETQDFYYGVNVRDHRPAVMPLYPEVENGKYKLINTTKNGSVMTELPFFDKTVWDSRYKSYIGSYLDLPSYASDSTASIPTDRQNSGIHIELLSDAGSSMKFRVFDDGHAHKWKDDHYEFSMAPENLCTKGGQYKLIQKCSYCGETKTTTYTQPANTHFRLISHERIEPTCTADGREEYYECLWCKNLYRDHDCTQKVSLSDLTIKGEHKWDDGVVIEPPTYYTDGIREYTCKVCGTSYWDSVDKLDHSEKKADDGTTCGEGAAMEVAEGAILSSSSEKDMPGSEFRLIRVKPSKVGKKSITLTWKSFLNEYAEEPDYFSVYGAPCGSSEFRKIDDVYGKSVTIKKIGSTNLKPKKYYKFLVVAVSGSSNEVMSTSKTIHVATTGSKKRANPTGVSVSKKIVKKAAKFKKGAKLSLKAKIKKKKGTTVKKHVGLRYESSARAIATVTKKGVIKAKSKGSCIVYAYCQNGVCKAIKVNVK